MSDNTAVLLPAARVDVYGLNKKTVDAANALVQDWRYARVAVRVVEGGIDNATTDYEQHVSPDLVIIETDDIGDGFIDKLEALAENCVEGTEAIIIGPKNDVELYRRLVSMGVRDYLVAAVKKDELAEVTAQILLDKKGLSDSRLITVIGTKGGVGTTTVAHMLGSVLADKMGHKTLLLDGSGGWGTLVIPFGAEVTTTLAEATRQVQGGTEDDIKRLLNKNSDLLTLLPTGGDPLFETSCDEAGFENMLDYFMKTYPVVVLDLSAAEHHIQRLALKKAHETIIVTTPLLPALRNCRTLLKELRGEQKEDDGKKPLLIVNMEGCAKGLEVPVKEIEKLLEYDVSLTLPHDLKLFVGNEAQEKEISRDKAAEKLMKPFIDFARTLVPDVKASTEKGEKGKKEGFLSKILKS
ncbi:MAG: type II secretion protein ATPase [Alphaproteobacteria bacterium]|nr:MAG: type II secretion protein ATPase [Alphaproteobacteria bacterium]